MVNLINWNLWQEERTMLALTLFHYFVTVSLNQIGNQPKKVLNCLLGCRLAKAAPPQYNMTLLFITGTFLIVWLPYWVISNFFLDIQVILGVSAVLLHTVIFKFSPKISAYFQGQLIPRGGLFPGQVIFRVIR